MWLPHSTDLNPLDFLFMENVDEQYLKPKSQSFTEIKLVMLGEMKTM